MRAPREHHLEPGARPLRPTDRVRQRRAEDRYGELAALGAHTHPAGMFVVTEAEAAAIRAVYEQRGEFSAAVELRRLFPAITDTAQARACARTIAGWKPLPVPPRPVTRVLDVLPKMARCATYHPTAAAGLPRPPSRPWGAWATVSPARSTRSARSKPPDRRSKMGNEPHSEPPPTTAAPPAATASRALLPRP